MTATQIAAQLETLHQEYKQGDIGMWNYKQPIEKLFELCVALAQSVAALEQKGN